MEGDWHFLGACEPEPILDRGWFNSAASRAMVVCSRTFFDFIEEGLQKEALVQRQGMCLMYNETSRYAATARLTVSVENPQGAPQSGAWVRFYVLNMAGLARIAALETGADGAVTLETGLGSLLVEAELNGKFAWSTLEISGDTAYRLVPQKEEPEQEPWAWDFIAPAAGEKTRRPLTPEQAREKAAVLASAGRPAWPGSKATGAPGTKPETVLWTGCSGWPEETQKPCGSFTRPPRRPASPGPRLCFSAWPLRTGGM